MFKKLLIANRGEIACRIIRTAQKMQIITCAIYSEADQQALHVNLADEAYYVGPAPSNKSYLNKHEIIRLALEHQVQAIHPGYGFLAEDPEFAQLCDAAGIIFVGPPAQAIAAMGDKNLAKITMQKAQVPITPGYQTEQQDLNNFKNAANEIGYPLLIKASAGGGGKGMRLVTQAKDFEQALTGAKREALASFGDDSIFLEKYLVNARHIEVQIMMDSFGNGIYLFDRDCSTQRRHQKIIEEAPAANISSTVRQQMAAAALKAATAIQYSGAGTIEFLLDEQENFYFMEMNTRLQVEHPVTEMITGLDLVEWQLRIAAGEALPCQQTEIAINGHAMEARIYAEDPLNNFLPSSGKITHYRMPAEQKNKVRVDSGIQQNDTVHVYYDPMLAKLIVWAKDRATAIQLLHQKLAEVEIVGITTNVALLSLITELPEFINGIATTEFLNKMQNKLQQQLSQIDEQSIILASLACIHQQQTVFTNIAKKSNDPYSPWFTHDGWRYFCQSPQIKLSLWHKQQSWSIEIVQQQEDIYLLSWNNQQFKAKTTWKDHQHLDVILNNESLSATCICNQQELTIFFNGKITLFNLQNPNLLQSSQTDGTHGLTAPMPGTVIEILVKEGQHVQQGDRLVVMEAMKMEHTLSAPCEGIIQSIHYQTGDRLEEGMPLLEINSDDIIKIS